MLYMVTFIINLLPPMLAYIPYMDPMGSDIAFLISISGSAFFFKGSRRERTPYAGITLELGTYCGFSALHLAKRSRVAPWL